MFECHSLGAMAGLVSDSDDRWNFKIQCIPLYSALLALNNPTVNYLSLDIEGAEFQVGLKDALFFGLGID